MRHRRELPISVIAIFYTDRINPWWLATAAAGLLIAAGMRRLGVNSPWSYIPLGVLVWFATLESGVHATLAGVVFYILVAIGFGVWFTLQHARPPTIGIRWSHGWTLSGGPGGGDVARARELAAALVEDDERAFGTKHRHTLDARALLTRWTGEAHNMA